MTSLNTPYATLSFVNAFSPRPKAEGTPPVFSCSLIFDPQQQKDVAFKALKDAVLEAAQREWGTNFNQKTLVSPFRDAGEKSYAGYLPGHVYISPWSKNKPGIVDKNRQEIELPEQVWSGQLVRANVTPFAWSHTGRRGVSFGWNGLQIIRSEGRERLDGRPKASDAFNDGIVDEDGPF
jgi:ssDNA-binding protein